MAHRHRLQSRKFRSSRDRDQCLENTKKSTNNTWLSNHVPLNRLVNLLTLSGRKFCFISGEQQGSDQPSILHRISELGGTADDDGLIWTSISQLESRKRLLD